MFPQHSFLLPSLTLLLLTLIVDTAAGGEVCPEPNAPPLCSPNSFNFPGTQKMVFSISMNKAGIGCLQPPFEFGDNPPNQILIYQYMWCDSTLDDRSCGGCISDATVAIEDRCGEYAAGAQYATKHCCLRYETYSFC